MNGIIQFLFEFFVATALFALCCAALRYAWTILVGDWP